MEYKYIPESIVLKDNIDYNEFLTYQLKYRESFENFLNRLCNISNADNYIKSLNVPIVNDKDYNFYHKFSYLNSDYIFLRNNIHIERLNEEEMSKILGSVIDNTLLPDDFILKTLTKVLYEEGDMSFYGASIEKYLAPSKSLIFEFAYEEVNCSIEKSKKIKETINNIFKNLKTTLESKLLNVPISFIINDGFSDLYKQDA